MKKDIKGYEKLSDELLEVETITLDTYIEYLKRVSDLGFGDTLVSGRPNKGALTPYYYKHGDTLEF